MEVLCREIPYGSAQYLETVELRDAVLRKPLGLVFTPEQLAAEDADAHLAAYDTEGRLLACLVMTPVDAHEVKMRQVAVAPDAQNQGIGHKLVQFSETWAAAKGYREIVLHARQTAVNFYLRQDYSIEGEPFEEVTIPHRRMRKRILKT